MKKQTKTVMALAVLCFVPGLVLACSVPVFRYALEHWQPDLYRISVYHDQDLSHTDRQLLDGLQEQKSTGANLQVELFDTREPLSPADQLRWEQLADKSSPQMVINMPVKSSALIGAGDPPVGTAPLQADAIKSLVTSPARDELASRLMRGEVVWVFLDSGKAPFDDALFEVLNQEIASLEQTLKLPEIEESDLVDLSTDPEELKIQFSSLRISREDIAEKWFIDMLLSVESDLRDDDVIDQPMVFPVFGRGRALYALVGKGIAAETIRQAATFLTGACQCTVKADNPGVDLLFPVRWDDFIEKSVAEKVEVELVGLGSPLPLSSAGTAGTASSSHSAEGATDSPESTSLEERFSQEKQNSLMQGGALPVSASRQETGSVLWLSMIVLVGITILVALISTSILPR